MAMPGYDLPPEIDAEQQRIAKQQAIAEAMLQRGMTPLPTNQGPLHWTQGIAQILNAYSGRKGMDAAAKDRAGLGAKYQQGLADEVKRIAAMRQGTPTTENIVDEQANDGMGAPAQIVTPGKAEQRGAIQAALLSKYAPVRQMGALEHRTFENEQTRAADRAARMELEIVRLRERAEDKALDRESREEAARRADQRQRELAEMNDATRRAIAGQRVSVSVPPPVTVTEIVRDGRVVKIDARTGRELGESPKESDAQKREGKRQFNMQGIGKTISEAEALLTDKAKPPTGSGIGAAVDAVGNVFGMNPSGSVQAQQLKAVAGALVSKMPRMEGPQSDKDVALYREMAGMVGDPSVTVERRVAALEKVKELWTKYERLNPDAFAGGGAPAGGGGAPRVVDW